MDQRWIETTRADGWVVASWSILCFAEMFITVQDCNNRQALAVRCSLLVGVKWQYEAMPRPVSLDELWNSSPIAERRFDPAGLAPMPEPARRYLQHAIAPFRPLARAVRLKMHGEIKLKRWLPFEAEQIISWQRGMIWRAAVQMQALSIRGSDTWVDGEGAMRWRLFGIVPVMSASGPDITRSAAGRVNIESIWLPSVLCDAEIAWTASGPSRFHASFTAHGDAAEIDYVTSENGALQSGSMPRWGNPDGGPFRLVNFGAVVEQEGHFGGFTIPTRVRAGWHFGTDRFERDGEFFRATIDDAIYR